MRSSPLDLAFLLTWTVLKLVIFSVDRPTHAITSVTLILIYSRHSQLNGNQALVYEEQHSNDPVEYVKN